MVSKVIYLLSNTIIVFSLSLMPLLYESIEVLANVVSVTTAQCKTVIELFAYFPLLTPASGNAQILSYIKKNFPNEFTQIRTTHPSPNNEMHKQNFPINQLHQQYKYIAFTTAYSHSEHWLTFRMSHARMLRHLVLTMQQEWLTAVMETQHSLDFLHKNRDCRWAFGAAIRQCLGCIPPISEQLLLIQVLLLPSQFPTNACHAKQR